VKKHIPKDANRKSQSPRYQRHHQDPAQGFDPDADNRVPRRGSCSTGTLLIRQRRKRQRDIRRLEDDEEQVQQHEANLRLRGPETERLARILVPGEVHDVRDGDDVDDDGHDGGGVLVEEVLFGEVKYRAGESEGDARCC
jgi:hypothetical protein